MSHTSALGMDDGADGGVSIIEVVDRAFAEGVSLTWPSGQGESRVWRCGNGASAWVHAECEHIECFVPVPDVTRKVRLRVKDFYPDKCSHCSGLICENVGAEGQEGVTPYPMAVQLADFFLSQPHVRQGEIVELALGAVGESVDVFADESAFDRVQRESAGEQPRDGVLGFVDRLRGGTDRRDDGPVLAPRSFIPLGLFPSDRGIHPSALIAGVVRSVSRRPPVPRIGKLPWVQVELETLDIVLECALDARDAESLRPGSILCGMFWMVAEGSRTWPTGAPSAPVAPSA